MPTDLTLPEALKEIQPSQYLAIASNDTTIFTLWPASVVRSFAAQYSDKFLLEDIYPIGTFPSGDIVCYSKTKIHIVLHETLELLKTRMPCDEFLARLMAHDPTIENEIY